MKLSEMRETIESEIDNILSVLDDIDTIEPVDPGDLYNTLEEIRSSLYDIAEAVGLRYDMSGGLNE